MKKRNKRRGSAPAPGPAASSTRLQHHDMPMVTRAAPVASVDPEARTVEIVWTAGARVRRFDWWENRWYFEELSLEPGAVRMQRLESGQTNLLNSHSTGDLSSVLGVIDSATIDATEGRCIARFSRRPDVEPYWQDVADGIIRNVSVGYDIHRIEMISPAEEGGTWTYLIVDWEPCEISLVPVGADAGAGTRTAPQENQRTVRCAFITPPAAAGTTEEVPMPKKVREAAAAAKRRADQQRNARLAQLRAGAAGSAVRTEGSEDDETDGEMEDDPEDPEDDPDADNEPDPEDPDTEEEDAEGERSGRASAIRASERRRITGIRNAVRMAGLPTNFGDELIQRNNGNLSVAAAGLECLREQSRRSGATTTRSPARIQLTRDEVDTRRERMGDAIALRANPRARLAPTESGQRTATEAAREYRGMNLVDMARECITAAGGNTRGMTPREVAQAALNLDMGSASRAGMLSTSDFPQLMANTVNRTLRTAYEEQPRTFTEWATPSTAPDFREVARVQLSGMSKMQKINEGGEYKEAYFSDAAEKYSLSKYGSIISITWEAIINDDLGAFSRIPRMIAAEAAALESDIVYAVLTGNPTMADAVALFHATHGNLMTAAAITDTTLGLARAAMRKQTTPAGRMLNLSPDILIVGPDKETEAYKYTSTNYVAAKSTDINPAYNTSLTVVVDARITGNAWFMASRPDLVDTVEYAYLEGENGLFTEQRLGFETDGLQIKARHVFAAKAIDHRGLISNPGA